MYKKLYLGLCFYFFPFLIKASPFDWFAVGDFRGHIEPCGCDPGTDLGGIKRLAIFFEREKEIYGDALIFDLGNNFSFQNKDTTIDEYLNRGLNRIDFTARLLNIEELKKDPDSLKDKRYILSNLKPKNPFLKRVQSIIVKNKIAIMGYTNQDEVNNLVISWGKSLRESWQRKLKPYKHSVLLFSGNNNELKKIIESKIFTLIISSNTTERGKPWSIMERNNPEMLYRTNEVLMTPHGGVGVLRGGKTSIKEARSLEKIIKKEVPLTSMVESKMFSVSLVSWLDISYDGSELLDDLFKEYRASVGSDYDKLVKERLPGLASSSFVGAASCKGCHPKIYQKWTLSSHAKAYPTLEQKKQNKNPSCIGCHVVGWDKKGGFVSKKESPHLAGVQCENCHGSRAEHIKNPLKKMQKASFKHCKSCHNSTHSPKFDKDLYWHKIKHGFSDRNHELRKK